MRIIKSVKNYLNSNEKGQGVLGSSNYDVLFLKIFSNSNYSLE